jgi:hypothetical protein
MILSIFLLYFFCLPRVRNLALSSYSLHLTTIVLQVLDSKGVDVTPRPLYHPDPHAASAKPNKLLTSQEGSLGSDYISSYSLYQNTLNPSMLGQYTR